MSLDKHYMPKNLSDKVALGFTKFLRFLADTFFKKRYGHRAVVLETVAAVPGMVAGMLLHLKSLRKMQDDKGWIKILLDEALLKSKNLNLRELIKVLITPLAERALDPKKDNYILKIMGELLTSADWRKKYALRGDKGPTAIKVTNMIFKILKKDFGEEIAYERLRFMGGTIMVTIAEWSISSTSPEWSEINNKPPQILEHKTNLNLSLRSDDDRIKNLADFIIGAITYQSSSKNQKTSKLKQA